MNYSDGAAIETGDHVRIEDGRTPGVIVDVIDTDRKAECGVNEPGVMIESEPLGLIYIPASLFGRGGLRFEARGAPTRLQLTGSPRTG